VKASVKDTENVPVGVRVGVKLRVIFDVTDSVHSGGFDLVGVKVGTEGLGVTVRATVSVGVVVNDICSVRVNVTPFVTVYECVGVPEAVPDLVPFCVKEGLCVRV